jgi:Fe-S cluster assembly iron-binding protein IscA
LPTFKAGTSAAFNRDPESKNSGSQSAFRRESSNGQGIVRSESGLQCHQRGRATANPMLTITMAAAARLAQMSEDRRGAEQSEVRVRCTGSQVAFESGNEQPGDVKFLHDSRVVLLVDADSARLLEDEVLDAEGPRLVFKRSRA